VVVTIDADGQHDPHEIPVVVAPIIQGHADMVIGSRFRETHSRIPLWRQVGQHGLTLVTNVASGVSSSDSQSGFRAFRADALRSLEIHGDGFSIESELQFWAHEHKLRVVEAPISVVYVEKAKRNPVQQALQVLNGIFGLVSQSRPLLFFGVSGLLVALLGVAFWYRVAQVYNLTHQLDMLPVILATLLIVIGILATFQGITLHTMRHIMVAQTQRSEPLASTRDGQGNCGGAQNEMAQDMNRA
jgi:glycosyltransferase involved in cell wall biosynthesis